MMRGICGHCQSSAPVEQSPSSVIADELGIELVEREVEGYRIAPHTVCDAVFGPPCSGAFTTPEAIVPA